MLDRKLVVETGPSFRVARAWLEVELKLENKRSGSFCVATGLDSTGV